MAGARLTGPRFPLDERLPPPVEIYLAELEDALPTRTSATNAILAEVADGLLECVDAHRSKGQDGIRAARSAVAEFGPARELARAFTWEMTGTTAHRVGLALVATGPVVGLAWLTTFALSSGSRWSEELPSVLTWLPGYGVLMFLVVAAAVVATLAGRGPATRVSPLGPYGAATAAIVAAVGCVAIDAMLLTHLGSLAAAGAPPGTLVVIPAVLSLTRLLLAVVAARRCLVLRAAIRAS
jgi:hypothetical protein